MFPCSIQPKLSWNRMKFNNPTAVHTNDEKKNFHDKKTNLLCIVDSDKPLDQIQISIMLTV